MIRSKEGMTPVGTRLSGSTAWNILVLRGSETIVKKKDALVRLSERCGQVGAMEHLEYFLQRPKFATKNPCLILFSSSSEGEVPESSDDFEGAILLYEYQMFGIGCRVYVADYHGGDRTVIAPPSLRAYFAALGCATMLKRGALAVQLTYETTPYEEPISVEDDAATKGVRGRPAWRFASSLRKMHGYIPLAETFDETLSALGKHTRRNLRAVRRQAEATIGYSFVVDPVMSKEEFLAMNRSSTHPVAEELAAWRYDATKLLPRCLLLGIRSASGEWLSLIGGRRHRGGTVVEWQINRSDLPKLSLGTLMRSHLLEYEGEQGSRRLYLVGGTSHTMKHSQGEDYFIDFVGLIRPLPQFLLRRLARPVVLEQAFLIQTLADPNLKWQRW